VSIVYNLSKVQTRNCTITDYSVCIYRDTLHFTNGRSILVKAKTNQVFVSTYVS